MNASILNSKEICSHHDCYFLFIFVELGPGLMQGQQPYYMQSQQRPDYSNYNASSQYHQDRPVDSHDPNEQQHDNKNV